MKPGIAFGDYITTEKTRRHSGLSGPSEKNLSIRSFLLPVVIFLSCGMLFVRLFSLQIINGFYYRGLSDANKTRTKIIHAPRGVIFDRNGVPLVFNTPGFREQVNGKTVQLTRDEATAKIAKGDLNLEIDTLRDYPYKEITSHVLGYLGEISKDELGSASFAAYRGGDLIGKMGIEEYYESMLKGTDGKSLLEVDANGNFIRSLGETEPVPGQDISLTLDINLQKAVSDSMKDVKKGAVVVSSPDGEILAMVSKPAFDPNLFTLGDAYKTASDASYTKISDVITDNDNQPLLNRAISGVYPPGSTFKLVTAAAGLETKTIDENYQVDDTGVLKIGEFSFANWYYTQYGRTEGMVNVVKAIKRSNDIFFYQLAGKVGVDKLSGIARLFGIGDRLGIDMQSEAKGLLPTQLWKERVMKEPWYTGDTYHYGIGQGYLLTTPLQVNAWTQVIANGGTLYKPRLIRNSKVDPPAGGRNSKFINDKALSLIREGMQESCSTGGVAWPLFDFKVKNEKLPIDNENITSVASSSADFRHVVLGCKTGTAQHGGEETLPHAWITVIAPLKKPQLVVTVLVESSGEGSNIAGPIAKKILESWFSR